MPVAKSVISADMLELLGRYKEAASAVKRELQEVQKANEAAEKAGKPALVGRQREAALMTRLDGLKEKSAKIQETAFTKAGFSNLAYMLAGRASGAPTASSQMLARGTEAVGMAAVLGVTIPRIVGAAALPIAMAVAVEGMIQSRIDSDRRKAETESNIYKTFIQFQERYAKSDISTEQANRAIQMVIQEPERIANVITRSTVWGQFKKDFFNIDSPEARKIQEQMSDWNQMFLERERQTGQVMDITQFIDPGTRKRIEEQRQKEIEYLKIISGRGAGARRIRELIALMPDRFEQSSIIELQKQMVEIQKMEWIPEDIKVELTKRAIDSVKHEQKLINEKLRSPEFIEEQKKMIDQYKIGQIEEYARLMRYDYY